MPTQEKSQSLHVHPHNDTQYSLHRNFAKKLHSIECNFFVFSIPDKYKTSNIYGFKTQGIGIGDK